MTEPQAPTLDPRQRAALHIARCASGIIEDEASLRASSLAFSLIFCAAPLGAMLLSLSSMFPSAFSFVPFLFERAGPKVLPSVLDGAALAFKTFAVNAEHLSLISLAFALASTLLLSMQIEKCVQSCWGSEPSIDAANPLARHWLALTLTPCALALFGSAAYQAFRFAPGDGSALASLFLLFCFFFLCSWALPSGRAPLSAACAASALASLECLAINSVFSFIWSQTQSYGAIYGVAAVFLGALLWIWLFWLSFLTSISICSTLMLGRPRNTRAAGLGFFVDYFSIPSCLAEPAAALAAPAALIAPQNTSGLLALDPPLESSLIEAAASDPKLADRGAYLALLDGSNDLLNQRQALGGACAARLARAMIDQALKPTPLANPIPRDKIDSH